MRYTDVMTKLRECSRCHEELKEKRFEKPTHNVCRSCRGGYGLSGNRRPNNAPKSTAPRTRGEEKKARDAEIVKKFKDGKKRACLAHEYKVSYDLICQIVRHGVPEEFRPINKIDWGDTEPAEKLEEYDFRREEVELLPDSMEELDFGRD